MTRTWYWLLFGGLLLLAMLALVPLRLLRLDRAGVSASAATGTIWDGRLTSARIGGVAMGDIEIGLAPLPLLAGTLRLNVAGAGVTGAAIKSLGITRPSGFGVAALNGLIGPVNFGGIPVNSIEFVAVEIFLEHGACIAASGLVRVKASAVLADGEALTGTARCVGDAVMVPLASISGQTRLDVRIDAAGRYSATLAVDGATEGERLVLLAAGFRPTPRGLALVTEGSVPW